MTVNEWAEDFKSYVSELQMPRDDYKGIMKYIDDALAIMKEQESILGIHQTVDGITFISTGTAQQGEERGIMLGKSYMHDWLKKELIHRGLITDEIKDVFRSAKIV